MSNVAVAKAMVIPKWFTAAMNASVVRCVLCNQIPWTSPTGCRG